MWCQQARMSCRVINSLAPIVSEFDFREIQIFNTDSLVQIMACRLFGAKPLSELMLDFCLWDLENKFQWHFNSLGHQAITRTNVGLSLVRSSDMHLRAVSHLIPLPPFTKSWLGVACIRFHSNLPGVNELIQIQLLYKKNYPVTWRLFCHSHKVLMRHLIDLLIYATLRSHVVITRSIITWFCTYHGSDWGKI